jgi:hypothetical protein
MNWTKRYENDERYTIKGNIVYVRKSGAKIPLFEVSEGKVNVSFDRRVSNAVKKALKHFHKEGFEIRLISPITFDPKFMRKNEDVIIRENIRNMLHNWRYETFFDYFDKSPLDYTTLMMKYIEETDSMEIFDEEYEDVIKYINKKGYHWFGNGEAFYHDSDRVRDAYNSLRRNIKLVQILNEMDI